MEKLTLEALKYYDLSIDTNTGIITAKEILKARFRKEEIENDIKDTLLAYCKKYKDKNFINRHYNNNYDVGEMFNFLFDEIRIDEDLIKEFIGED